MVKKHLIAEGLVIAGLALTTPSVMAQTAGGQNATGKQPPIGVLKDSIPRNRRDFVKSDLFTHPPHGDPYFNSDIGTSPNGQVSWNYDGRKTPSVERLNGNRLAYEGYNENGAYLLDRKASAVYVYDENGTLKPSTDEIAQKLIHGQSGASGLFNNPRAATSVASNGNVPAGGSADATNHPVAPINKEVAKLQLNGTDAKLVKGSSGYTLTFKDASGGDQSFQVRRPPQLEGKPIGDNMGSWIAVKDKETIIVFQVANGRIQGLTMPSANNPLVPVAQQRQ